MKDLFEQGRPRLSLVTKRPDYSSATTRERVLSMSDHGQLARTLLIPTELGGADAEANEAYLPPQAVDLQKRLTATLQRYFNEGRIDRFTVDPEYKKGSLVPARIRVSAGHSTKGVQFTTVIGIW